MIEDLCNKLLAEAPEDSPEGFRLALDLALDALNRVDPLSEPEIEITDRHLEAARAAVPTIGIMRLDGHLGYYRSARLVYNPVGEQVTLKRTA